MLKVIRLLVLWLSCQNIPNVPCGHLSLFNLLPLHEQAVFFFINLTTLYAPAALFPGCSLDFFFPIKSCWSKILKTATCFILKEELESSKIEVVLFLSSFPPSQSALAQPVNSDISQLVLTDSKRINCMNKFKIFQINCPH